MQVGGASRVSEPRAAAPGIAAVGPAREAAPSSTGDAFERPARSGVVRRTLLAMKPFAQGAVSGAVHPFHVVQKEKLKAGIGLAGLAAASAGWAMMGLPDPTMGIVAGGGLVVGYDAWQVGRDLPSAPPGEERRRVAGSVASKFGLWALTSAVAHLIAPGEAHTVAAHVAAAPEAFDFARTAALGAASGLAAGADAVLFGLDAADHKKHADAHDDGAQDTTRAGDGAVPASARDAIVVTKPLHLRLLLLRRPVDAG